MSKYIRLDEATDLFRGIDATMTGSFVADTLESLPTIEVSEEQVISKLTELVNSTVETIKGGFNKQDSKLEVSEDCISREWLLNAFGLSEKTRKWDGDHSGYDTMMLYEIQDYIEDAPSVIPQSKEGEWIPCTKEGYPLTELGRREGQKWYGYKCSKCNFIYKGNALTESPFCQNCGAKMRLK